MQACLTARQGRAPVPSAVRMAALSAQASSEVQRGRPGIPPSSLIGQLANWHARTDWVLTLGRYFPHLGYCGPAAAACAAAKARNFGGSRAPACFSRSAACWHTRMLGCPARFEAAWLASEVFQLSKAGAPWKCAIIAF